jgi:hypothetical protein
MKYARVVVLNSATMTTPAQLLLARSTTIARGGLAADTLYSILNRLKVRRETQMQCQA